LPRRRGGSGSLLGKDSLWDKGHGSYHQETGEAYQPARWDHLKGLSFPYLARGDPGTDSLAFSITLKLGSGRGRKGRVI